MNTIAETLSEWFGSTPFIIFHIVWFGAWTLAHTAGFDRDWSLLTLIVSLEAIFLSLFILRAENLQAGRLERKNDVELKLLRKVSKELHDQRYLR